MEETMVKRKKTSPIGQLWVSCIACVRCKLLRGMPVDFASRRRQVPAAGLSFAQRGSQTPS